ncbi:MAG TPA: BatD family protein [Lentimicrobium sp.]|nr:BatD family protein [Lentimicrobium sp.]
MSIKSVNIKFLIPVLFLLLTTNLAFNQDVQFRASAPDQVAVGDQFRLIFSVNAEGDGFKAPPVRDFSLLSGPNRGSSSSMKIINNKVSRTIENTYTYLLQAVKEGTFTIGSASIVVDGKTYQTSPITIKVVKGSGGQQSQPQQENVQPGADISSKNLFLRTSVSKNNPYQGEQVIVTYKLYTRVPIADMAIKKVPALTGFWKENLLENNVNYKQYKEVVNGLEYNVAEIKKDALFAQKSGNLIIDPLELDVIAQVEVKRRRSNDPFDDFFNDSFFGRNYQNIQKTLSSNPITLNIRPLPETTNKDFTGAVGSYNINSSVDKTTLNANDALTLKFTVTGRGNIKMIDKPNFIFPPDFEVYDPKINDNVHTTDAGMSGSRTFEFLIVPRNHGKYTIKSVPFVYFNLANGSFKTLKTPDFNIIVEKGTGNEAYVRTGPDKQDLQYIGTDIRFIRTGIFKLKPINHFFYGSPLFWVLLVLPLLLFILFIIIWQKELKKRGNVALMRNKKATGIARKRLRAAEQYLKQDNQALFCTEISNALWGYLSDKFNIPRSTLSIDSVNEALQKKQVNEEIINKFISTLNNCEYARFAPGVKTEIMGNLYSEALNVITQTEQELK